MSFVKTDDFDYHLPGERIALHPPKVRGTSRLLALDRKSGSLQHLTYPDIAKFLRPGDVVVLNNTEVIKARLEAVNTQGKSRELLLLEQHGHEFGIHRHRVLYRGKLRINEMLLVQGHPVTVEAVEPGGIATISCSESLLELSNQYGTVPLPPYMKRLATTEDTKRYQTVFARQAGSVAAPTASLNFTDDLVAKLTAKGVNIVYLTLHVGLGTFLPIRVDDVTKHQMHSEYFEIPADTIAAIQQAKKSGHKVLAVGTTVTRTLEYAHQAVLERKPQDITGEANIFIYPSYQFKVIDMLLTNFHAPRSTVLMLTAAFAGWDKLEPAYQEAIDRHYNLLSYGDSMFIY